MTYGHSGKNRPIFGRSDTSRRELLFRRKISLDLMRRRPGMETRLTSSQTSCVNKTTVAIQFSSYIFPHLAYQLLLRAWSLPLAAVVILAVAVNTLQIVIFYASFRRRSVVAAASSFCSLTSSLCRCRTLNNAWLPSSGSHLD